MDRHGNKPSGRLAGLGKAVISVGMMLGLASCGDGPGMPGPPQGPPRPVTGEAFITTAHFHLPAKPPVPRPGLM
ncbi:MAG TPA: hypothetical protein VGE12_18105 [Noviherbaspirillum sp.]